MFKCNQIIEWFINSSSGNVGILQVQGIIQTYIWSVGVRF